MKTFSCGRGNWASRHWPRGPSVPSTHPPCCPSPPVQTFPLAKLAPRRKPSPMYPADDVRPPLQFSPHERLWMPGWGGPLLLLQLLPRAARTPLPGSTRGGSPHGWPCERTARLLSPRGFITSASHPQESTQHGTSDKCDCDGASRSKTVYKSHLPFLRTCLLVQNSILGNLFFLCNEEHAMA